MKRLILLVSVLLLSVSAYSQCDIKKDGSSYSTKRVLWASPFTPKMEGSFSKTGDSYFVSMLVSITTPATIQKGDQLVFEFEDNQTIAFDAERQVSEHSHDLTWFYFLTTHKLTPEQLELFQTKKVIKISLEHNQGGSERLIKKKYQKRILAAAKCIGS